ncbi:MAG TPA: hypothetical protein PLP06_13000, partial [Saprospiraceae bacterium]|nr:hypothetical protein [Saprospiraceae bacterium]
ARAAYKLDLQKSTLVEDQDIYTGLAIGASVNLFLNKETGSKFSIDYAYRTTRVFDGTHNLGVRFNFGSTD